MGGFNINLPGLNFNLTPEAIDAARAAQGLPPLNPPPRIPAPMPPVASPAGDPTIVQSPVQAFAGRPEPMAERPSIGQGVGSFLLNERFGQNIPVEPRIPAQPMPVAAPAPRPVAAAPPPPPPQAMPQPRDMLGRMALSAPSERFEPIQADLPIQPVPQPPPVVAPPPPPIIDSEGIPSVITPPPVIAPPPPPPVPAPAPVVAPPPVEDGTVSNDMGMSDFLDRQALEALTPVATPAPAPVTAPLASMRDRLANSSLNEFLGLAGGRPMSSETRWGQPVPAQRPRVTPTPPEPTPPAVDEGIASLTRDAISATQYPGLEGFDPANPLNPVAAPAPAPAPTPAASTVPLTGGPPIGYQGGGGEYNPQNGYTDEDRLAESEFYAQQQRARLEKQFADREAAQPAPPPPLIDSPPVEDDYVEVPIDTGPDDTAPPPDDTGPDIPVYDPDLGTDTGAGDTVPTDEVDTGGDLFTPAPVVDAAPPSDEGIGSITPEPVEDLFVPQPVYRYSYRPYVPQEFSYVVPEFARNFGPFAGFMPAPFRGGVSDVESGTTYTDIPAPEAGPGGEIFQPVPTFEVARPEYVQITGPADPVVDPFATPIRPEFAPLPSYERTAYAPRTQKMIDQILSEEEIANPFMNPYLRSGVFGGR